MAHGNGRDVRRLAIHTWTAPQRLRCIRGPGTCLPPVEFPLTQRDPMSITEHRGEIRGAEPINDILGHTVGRTRPWGKGKLIAYGIFPDEYTTNPHPRSSQQLSGS